MAFTFPTNPTNGDTHVQGGVTYTYVASNDTWVGDTNAPAPSGTSAFIENLQVVSADYTVPSGKNAGSFGPVTIDNGVTVTVPTGSTWTVV